MKKICGALVIGLMITTNAFAYDECNDMFQAGYDKGHEEGYDKGWKEGYMQADCSSVLSISSDSRVRALEMRLIECNSRNGWKY